MYLNVLIYVYIYVMEKRILVINRARGHIN